MFFNLTTNKTKNFTLHFDLPNGLILNTDEGWESFDIDDCTIILKGYSNLYDLRTLATYLTDCKRTSIKGNFCAFVCKDDKVTILHDKDRGFPIWVGDKTVTNLFARNEEPVWEDCSITIDKEMHVTRQWEAPYVYKKKESLTDTQVIDKIDSVLSETFENFLAQNKTPLKIFLTGGIDTLLAWTYLDSFTKNYEIVDYEYMKYTYFYSMNQKLLETHQPYKQVHLWNDPTVLITGMCGDEYFMRGPHTSAQCLKYHGYNLLESLKESDYMYYFFNRKNCTAGILNGIDAVKPDQSIEDVYTDIFNRNKNDHQHWHIDNTITFTPFKDTSIMEIILRGRAELLLDNARDAAIEKMLIEKRDPKKLKFLEKRKNTTGCYSKYWDKDSSMLSYNKLKHIDEEQ